MRNFQKYHVYQQALQFTRTARSIVRNFPREEQFVLSTQFIRAADSITLNFAEGAGATSEREFARFLQIAVRSAHECVGCLDIAHHNAFISPETYDHHVKTVNELIAMLVSFRRTVLGNRQA